MASITRKIGEGTVYSFSQNFLVIMLGAVSTILVIRHLGAYQYGLVVLAMSISNTLNVFLDFGIGNVVISDIAASRGADNTAKAKKLLKEYLVFEIITGIILFVAAFAISFFADAKYGVEISGLVKIASFLVIVNAAKNVFMAAAQSFLKFNLLATFFMTESAAKLLFVLFFVVIYGGGMVTVMTSYLVSSLFAGLLVLPFIVKAVKKVETRGEPGRKNLLKLFKEHGKFQIGLRFLQSLLDPIKVWVIRYFAGAEAVAIFQVGFRFFGYLSQLIFAASTPLLSVMSEEFVKGKDSAAKIAIMTSKYLTWISLFAMVITWIFIPNALELFFGEKYLSSVSVIRWFLVGYLIGGLNTVMKPIFFALRAQKALLFSDTFAFFVSYPLAAYLTYKYGVIGFAVPAGTYLSFIARYFYLKKKEPLFAVRIGDLFSWKKEDTYFARRIYSVVLRKLKRRQPENGAGKTDW